MRNDPIEQNGTKLEQIQIKMKAPTRLLIGVMLSFFYLTIAFLEVRTTELPAKKQCWVKNNLNGLLMVYQIRKQVLK